MKFSRVFLIMAALAVFGILLACAPLFGQEKQDGSLYELLPGSTYQEGCVGRCKCPIRMASLSGTFVLTRKSGSPSEFDISGIQWSAGGVGGKALHSISGGGTYQKAAGTHRLTLDLSIDGSQAGFDTGFVPGGADFPNIKINADQGGKCLNRWVDIIAAPKK